MKLIWYLLLVFISVSCVENKPASNETTVFGKIVNPLNSQLILTKNGQSIDTFDITDEGDFHFKFKQDEESIFFFRHGAEKQMMYTKPGDSIAFRLNTLSFDETLVFDGNSAAENNFLVNCFLLNEKNNEVILSYHKTSVNHFIQMMDSLKEFQESKLSHLKKNNQLSPYFIEVAEKSINFEFYDMKERFSFLIQKYFPEKVEELQQHNFFSHRAKINFNEDKLYSHIGYLRFLDNYIKNKSIEDCYDLPENEICFDLNTYDNLSKRINIAKDLFDDNYLKNQFIKRFIRKEIIQSNTEEQIAGALQILDEVDIDKADKHYFKRLANFQSNFLIGKSIHQHHVYNHLFKTVAFNEIAHNKPMLLYLWSANSTSMHQKRLAKVKELRMRFPEVEFIGINIDFDNKQLWKRTLSQYNYNKNFEYQVIEEDDDKDLYENYLSKVFFVDAKSGVIQNSSDLMYSEYLESTLVAFLNQ